MYNTLICRFHSYFCLFKRYMEHEVSIKYYVVYTLACVVGNSGYADEYILHENP